MGYTTEFDGYVTIEPPLNEHEVSFLKDLASTRRMLRRNGPLFVKGGGYAGQDHEEDIINFNCSSGEQPWLGARDLPADWRDYFEPDGQPGLWCKWEPSDDGETISWNGAEKFYDAPEWMRYIIDKLLAPSADEYLVKHNDEDERLQYFTCDHTVNGVINAEGEEQEDVWRLEVKDNIVSVREAKIVWE
jgi:hypothetical protein